MKNRIILKLFTFLLLFLSLVVFAQAQEGGGTTVELFPSGFGNPDSPAGVVNSLYIWAISISGTLAVVMIIYGGAKYVFSAGSAGAQSEARDIIKNAIWGILLLAGAYLILNTINPRLVDLGANNPELEVLDTGETAPPDVPDGQEDANRRILQAEGIVFGYPRCAPNQNTGCLRLGNVRPQVLGNIIAIKNMCDSWSRARGGSDCSMTINSGTEGIHSTEGTCIHANGYKVDIDDNATIDEFITTQCQFSRNRRNGDPEYLCPGGGVYARESDHWDVAVGC